MQFTNAILALGAVAVATAAAPAAVSATSSPFKVKVGADGLSYTPSNILAPVGTQIEFEFFPKNHTVTQSSFKDPCHPLSTGGFFSGFVPTSPSTLGSTFTITVKDTKPIWFYCSQTVLNHCQAGMVGSINAAQSGNATLDAFIELAKAASTSTFPQGGVTGGDLRIASNSSSSSSGTGTGSSTATGSSGGSIPTGSASPTTLSTPSGTFPGPTSTPSAIQASGAVSGFSTSMFALAAAVLGVMAMA